MTKEILIQLGLASFACIAIISFVEVYWLRSKHADQIRTNRPELSESSAGVRLHLVHPPARPGSCKDQGIGAAAISTDGYLYLCTSAGWLRSTAPMTLDWR